MIDHRARTPEQTWEAFSGVFERVGITRVAELTRLDRIGIPVFQAVRPLARSLTLSQGKGLSAASARVGAAMESVEVWHAERPSVDHRAPIREVALQLPYNLEALTRSDMIVPIPPARIQDWTTATSLVNGSITVVPTEAIRFDLTLPVWPPRVFDGTTNGLASGNTLIEAQLHGMLEVIERDSVARTLAQYSSSRVTLAARAIDPHTVTGPASRMLEAVWSADCTVTIADMTADWGVATLVCVISSRDTVFRAGGFGCDPDREVALSRAVCEAAQSRLTMISGARDDIDTTLYRHPSALDPLPSELANGEGVGSAFSSVPTAAVCADPSDELNLLVSLLKRRGHMPVAVDLTDSDLGLPVTKIIVPTLTRFDF
ncbi:YcaO-like family protein [Rhodococcus jostii]|uniref:YcaO-like family protein n=1 Tax=Rhodococcus jostii TaxID=132919 RepID=UPI00363E6521